MTNEILKRKELANRFKHYPSTGSAGATAAKHQNIRHNALKFAETIELYTPYCREQDLAVSKIEEAMFWANAAIARYQV